MPVAADLSEYDAVVAKVDAAVAKASASASVDGELACRAGCDSCCVAGLSVLPVEAAALRHHLAEREAAQAKGGEPLAVAAKGKGHCVFLDVAGRCSVYAARPILCRTHGLPLRTTGEAPRGSLRVVGGDVTVCHLNFTTRAPTPTETLDATAILQLLVVVDRRHRERVGLADDTSRVALQDLHRDHQQS